MCPRRRRGLPRGSAFLWKQTDSPELASAFCDFTARPGDIVPEIMTHDTSLQKQQPLVQPEHRIPGCCGDTATGPGPLPRVQPHRRPEYSDTSMTTAGEGRSSTSKDAVPASESWPGPQGRRPLTQPPPPADGANTGSDRRAGFAASRPGNRGWPRNSCPPLAVLPSVARCPGREVLVARLESPENASRREGVNSAANETFPSVESRC